MQITVADATDMLASLSRCEKPSGNPDFAYAASWNASLLKAVASAAESERMELARGFAKVGPDGEPIVQDGGYVIRDAPGFSKAIEGARCRTVDLPLQVVRMTAKEWGQIINKMELSAVVAAGLFPMLDIPKPE